MSPNPLCPYAGCNSPEGECLGVCCADSRGRTVKTASQDHDSEWEQRWPNAVTPEPQAQAGEPDNWQQYAKDGENAQQCIERHRKERDILLELLKTARRPYSDNEEMKL